MQRSFGLDLLRVLAIFFVIAGHLNEVVSPFFSVRYIDGVELFFVLSGFLVGSIILNDFQDQAIPLKNRLLNFLQRRWFRTLPNYYLFLFINILLVYFGIAKGELNQLSWVYFLFLQNLYVPVDFMFWESWSLAVEEWFYLLFPVLLVLILSFKKNYRYTFLSVVVLFILVPLVYRYIQFNLFEVLDNWDLWYRKLVFTRLDAIGFGVAVAYFYKYHENRFKNTRYFLFFNGALIYFILPEILGNYSSLKIFELSITSLAIALWIPFLYYLNTNFSWLKKGVEWVSKTSYSMYLAHLPLLAFFGNYFKQDDLLSTLVVYIVYWIGVLTISSLIYSYYEKPVMKLRHKVSAKLLA